MIKANNHSPMQKQFFATYEEKRKACFLYVARELTGRAKQRELISKEKTLDWKKFNDYFNEFYVNYTSDQLLEEIFKNVYWLADETSVIDLYFRYLQDAQRQSNTRKDSNEEEEFDFVK